MQKSQVWHSLVFLDRFEKQNKQKPVKDYTL